MFDRTGTHPEYIDVEDMVRAAGNYLDVTDDLRAQTLETAHIKNCASSNRLRIAVLAVIVVCLAISTSMMRGSLSSMLPLMAGVAADGDQPYAVALQKTAQAHVDPNGSLPDAFSELRHHQAKLIQDAF